jgi:beta-fructofuranosidase
MGLAEEAPVLAAVSAELKITVNAPFSLSLRDQAALHWTGEHLILQRHNWRTGNMEQRVWTGIVFELQILLDASSIEIFINEGAACMSARYFPDESQKTMHFAGTQPIAIHYWPLSACTIA